MKKREIRRKVREFRRENQMSRVTKETLREAAERMGYSLVPFNPVVNDEDVELIIRSLSLQEMIGKSSGFVYEGGQFRLLFISEKLSEREKVLVLAHEIGHIVCGHNAHKTVVGQTVQEEYEANEFAHYLLGKSPAEKAGDFLAAYKWPVMGAAAVLAVLLLGLMGWRNLSRKDPGSIPSAVGETETDEAASIQNSELNTGEHETTIQKNETAIRETESAVLGEESETPSVMEGSEALPAVTEPETSSVMEGPEALPAAKESETPSVMEGPEALPAAKESETPSVMEGAETLSADAGVKVAESRADVEILKDLLLPLSSEYVKGAFHFLVLRNNTERTISIQTRSKAFGKDGNLLGSASAVTVPMGPGCVIVTEEDYTAPEDIAYFESSMETVSAAEPSMLPYLSYDIAVNQEGAVISMTNRGSKSVYSLTGYALFFREGRLVGCDYAFFGNASNELKPWMPEKRQLYAPRKFDDVEFYILSYGGQP